MPTLEQITQTGMLSVDRSRNMRPEMISMGEQLIGEEFAAAINSGELSAKDAFINFWSYEESVELWKLDPVIEWRGFLPDWANILLRMGPSLETGKADEIVDVGLESFNNYTGGRWGGSGYSYYNPFLDDLYLICSFSGRSNVSQEKLDYLASTINGFIEHPNSRGQSQTSLLIHLFVALAAIQTEKAVRQIEKYLEGNLSYCRGFDDDIGQLNELLLPIIKSTRTRLGDQIIEAHLLQEFKRQEELGYNPKRIRFQDISIGCSYPDLPFSFGRGYASKVDSRERALEGLRYYISPRGFYYGSIRAHHMLSKPRGYNPPEKRLAA